MNFTSEKFSEFSEMSMQFRVICEKMKVRLLNNFLFLCTPEAKKQGLDMFADIKFRLYNPKLHTGTYNTKLVSHPIAKHTVEPGCKF